MSILATSSTSTRHFDMGIAEALSDVNAAIIVQQLDYWIKKEGVGVIVDGIKYIYNTYRDWTRQQFRWLSERQFRNSMDLLRSLQIVEVIQHKSKRWNQTNYYSLNYSRLKEFLKSETGESIEIVELTVKADRNDKTSQIEMTNSDTSLYKSKSTAKDRTTKQFAAASLKIALEEETQSNTKHYSARLTALNSQIKQESTQDRSNPDEEKKTAEVDYLVNKNWSKLIPLLDGAGVPINRTIKDLLKLYPVEKVESAISLIKARKRESHIPNPSGYFVSALKGDWGAKNLVSELRCDRTSQEVDRGAIFRHWYDLSRELGYCSGQEVREGEQWICLSGSWEKWETAVNRGYSLDYLKKIMKRNNRN